MISSSKISIFYSDLCFSGKRKADMPYGLAQLFSGAKSELHETKLPAGEFACAQNELYRCIALGTAHGNVYLYWRVTDMTNTAHSMTTVAVDAPAALNCLGLTTKNDISEKEFEDLIFAYLNIGHKSVQA